MWIDRIARALLGDERSAEFVSDVLATTATPVVIRATDGPRTAKFDCGGTGDFFFSHVRAIVIDGLEIANTAGHGVQLDSGSGLATKTSALISC